MNTIAIKVEGLSKRYEIGHFHEANLTERLRETGRQLLRLGRHTDENVYWALRDISFEVEQGSVLGIIGRNGAGKSTLLKILSRVTTPTSGQALLKGRIASLLEVGTGFHPELTGRENIYLNGAILGMNRREINRNFEAIVDFSGVHQFLDTPVKRYSSGMYVRLAFAVAAHLQAEIMIVDEVLAVGDAEFQKKCLGMMGDVAKSGRTVLFVSHNMAAIRNLCRQAILLQNGTISFNGDVETAVTQNTSRILSDVSGDLRDLPRTTGGETFRFTHFRLLDERHQVVFAGRSGKEMCLSIHYEAQQGLREFDIGFAVFDQYEHRCFSISTLIQGIHLRADSEQGAFLIRFPRIPLNEGSYFATIEASHCGCVLDRIDNAFPISILAGDYYGTGKMPDRANPLLVDFSFTQDEKD